MNHDKYLAEGYTIEEAQLFDAVLSETEDVADSLLFALKIYKMRVDAGEIDDEILKRN